MSHSFTKLFSSITESTVWGESHATRIVWITMLAMADRMGRVSASVPGLANRARVTLEECEHALERFMSPDKYSRTPDNDGRRIEPIEGGWRLINHSKYREMRDEDARKEYMREYMRGKRKHDELTCKQEKLTVNHGKPQLAQAEAEAEAEADKKSNTLSGKPDVVPPKSKVNGENRLQAEEVLQFLNTKTGKNYKPVDANLELIVARLKEGYTVQDLRTLTARKVRDWSGDEKMAQFLRPKTLYNKTNAAQYLGECVE